MVRKREGLDAAGGGGGGAGGGAAVVGACAWGGCVREAKALREK